MTVCRSGIIAFIIFNEFLVTKTDIVIEHSFCLAVSIIKHLGGTVHNQFQVSFRNDFRIRCFRWSRIVLVVTADKDQRRQQTGEKS